MLRMTVGGVGGYVPAGGFCVDEVLFGRSVQASKQASDIYSFRRVESKAVYSFI